MHVLREELKTSELGRSPERRGERPREAGVAKKATLTSTAITERKEKNLNIPKPDWHAPWKIKSVISGHLGWVRSIAVDPSNEFFVTGEAQRGSKRRAEDAHLRDIDGCLRDVPYVTLLRSFPPPFLTPTTQPSKRIASLVASLVASS